MKSRGNARQKFTYLTRRRDFSVGYEWDWWWRWGGGWCDGLKQTKFCILYNPVIHSTIYEREMSDFHHLINFLARQTETHITSRSETFNWKHSCMKLCNCSRALFYLKQIFIAEVCNACVQMLANFSWNKPKL